MRECTPGGVWLVVLVGAVAVGGLWADPVPAQGPDIVVSDLYELLRWGSTSDGTIQAYSVGTWACNIGDEPAVWYGGTDQHPVIAQNMFRLKAGRFEQIGQSWLKWGYVAHNTDFCGACVDPGVPGLLGVNCADSYSAAFNGYQVALGPKSVVNPFTGVFPATHPTPPATTVGGRLQVRTADFIGGANLYFVEGQYVSPDDSAAGNIHNNTSYRQVWVTPNLELTFLDSQNAASTVVPQQPAVAAWAAQDPEVFLAHVDVPGDGRLYIARRATPSGAGGWHYELAVQNVNSDRAVASVSIRLPGGFSATSLGFHSIAYHSGEPYDGAPWTGSVTADGVRWDTTPFAANPNANALRWGTLYNYWFDTDIEPSEVLAAELVLFKPGTPVAVEIALAPWPTVPGDCNCDGVVSFGDIDYFIAAIPDNEAAWAALYASRHDGGLPLCPFANCDADGDGSVGFADIDPFVAYITGGG